jgi:hypothetical protein
MVVAAEPAPVGFDHAGASRVLLGAQQMLWQLQACTTTAIAADPTTATASIDESSNTSASTVDELDEAESSMIEDDGDDVDGDENLSSVGSITSSSGNAGKTADVRQSSHADPGFDASWQDQLRKPGLLGALVAAAYPDRIAQLKPGSGGKPSYTLSTGKYGVGSCEHQRAPGVYLCSLIPVCTNNVRNTICTKYLLLFFR